MRIFKATGVVLLVAMVGVGTFAYMQISAYDASMEKVYDIPIPTVTRSTDPAVIARGKHLAESIAGCVNRDCHGPDLGGGKVTNMGPIGVFAPPNISGGGLGAAYSDGELARLIKHGVKKDGRSLRSMPAQDICWLPEPEIVALISFLRTLPPVDKPNGTTQIKTLGKILDRRGMIPLDIARRIDHDQPMQAEPAAPTAEYGALLSRQCTGCHGEHMSGGPIPGAPSTLAVPLNLTPHETGLKDWTYEDFDRLLTTNMRKNGKKVDPFMPSESFNRFNEIEKRAVWASLRALPPRPFGER
jgi:hypothetical protein